MIQPALEDRVALVTGSARGLGRELVHSIAACGADVAVQYHSSADAAAAVVDTVEAADGNAIAVQADVTDPESVDSAFETIEADLGSVDVLVNNVGEFAPRHWRDLDLETWNRVLHTNLNGTYLCSRRALPAMADQEWGRIVNVGYASAEKGMVNPKNFPYFVAKTGVLMFTRMLAADTQDEGITVNAVSPYVIENSEEFPEELPRGRPASFEDIAGAIWYFLTEEAAYVSGENVEIDGGWLPETV